MTKSILLNCSPNEALMLLNGELPYIIRKNVPLNFVGWVYIYVSKSGGYIVKTENYGWQHEKYFKYEIWKDQYTSWDISNGKIVARFWLEFTTKITHKSPLVFHKIKQTRAEIKAYAGEKEVALWSVKDLQIFDEPKEISEFYTRHDIHVGLYFEKKAHHFESVSKPPSNWFYIYKED